MAEKIFRPELRPTDVQGVSRMCAGLKQQLRKMPSVLAAQQQPLQAVVAVADDDIRLIPPAIRLHDLGLFLGAVRLEFPDGVHLIVDGRQLGIAGRLRTIERIAAEIGPGKVLLRFQERNVHFFQK